MVKSLANSHIRVLAMKLHLPFLPLDFIKRNQLMAQFEASVAPCQIWLLQSAPGYGKSLTLAQWFYQKKQQKQKVAWLTLDPKENDPLRFVTYLACAINSADASLANSAIKALEADAKAQDVFQLLMNELAQLDDVLYLALEDIHHLYQSEILELLDQLLTYTPNHLRLYLTSRKQMALPCARLLTQNKLKIMDENQLKFTPLETSSWLAKQSHDNPQDSLVNSAQELSQGWVAGLILLQKIQPDLNTINLQGDESILLDYFSQEWQNQLDEDEIRICQQLAIIGSASPEYLDVTFEQTGSAEIITRLLAKHVYVSSKVDHSGWIELHKMLQVTLHEKPNKEQLDGIFHRACNWLFEQDKNFLAIEMALKITDKQQAANILELCAEKLIEEQGVAQLLSWKQQLPHEVMTTSPKLIIVFSWALVFAQQYDEAERLMLQVDRFFVASQPVLNNEMSGQLFAIRAYIARSRGNIDNAIALCKQALEKLPLSNYAARTITFLNLSNIYMTLDKISLARDYNRQSFEAARSAGSMPLELIAIHEQARIEQVKGNLLLAQKLVDQGLSLSTRLKNRDHITAYGRLLIYKGYLCWLNNKVVEANQYLTDGLQVCERCHDVYLIMGQVVLSNLKRQSNQLEEAYDHLAYAEAKCQSWAVPSFIYQPWLTTIRINLLIDQGKLETASGHLKKMYALIDSNPYALSPEHFPALRGLLDVFYVRAKSIGGFHKDALNLLEKKLSNSGPSQQGFGLIFIYLMRALLRFQLGNEDEAIQDFRKAVDMAEHENCIMPFIEYSSGMAALYKHLPMNLKEKPFVQGILKHIDLSAVEGPNQAFAQARSVISQREMAVLKLIAQGLSNQEIAENLFISLHTVKTHARRINAKLAVKSRTQAIIKAREVGLI